MIFSLLIISVNVPFCDKETNKNNCAINVSIFIKQNSEIVIVYRNNQEDDIKVSKQLHITTSENDIGLNGYFKLFNSKTNKEIKINAQHSFLFDNTIYNTIDLSYGKSHIYEILNPFERFIEKATYKLVYYPKGGEFCQDSVMTIYKEK